MELSDEMKISKEQIQAACALNLCAVSVSQIIDYNDVNILEQEYDAILNNLNLENIPKDEALLDILKRLLETITFFKIQEGEKEYIEKEYQQKMKNAIWSAMPNPGALVSTGLSIQNVVANGGGVGLAVSLAATVGTAYMNYRKNKAEYQLNREKQYWELKKSAIEQFQALQQQLFETSWRLADKYNFPDILRLTKKQIRQYNDILNDQDDIRKYERLNSIKTKFIAYPPFWYFLGNTANTIATSGIYGLDGDEIEHYKEQARICFKYFKDTNRYDLLREDNLASSCYLEYADLLDSIKDKKTILELLSSAVKSAGNALDILQLCAIGYIRVGEIGEAKAILQQLVNEGYNEVSNAQLLSVILVNKYIENADISASSEYKLLESRINREYLFPMPITKETDKDTLQKEFIDMQRRILKTKYKLAITSFMRKYNAEINSIILLPEHIRDGVGDIAEYSDNAVAKEERIKKVQMVLGTNDKRSYYLDYVASVSYAYKVLEVLNKMFGSLMLLDCVQEEHKQLELRNIVENSVRKNRDLITEISESLQYFNEDTYIKTQDINLSKLTTDLFRRISIEAVKSVDNMTEMCDFSIAEYSLLNFCNQEGLETPEAMFQKRDDVVTESEGSIFFTPELIGDKAINQSERIGKNKEMINLIKSAIPRIVIDSGNVEFYTQEDARMNRYFYSKTMKTVKGVRIKTLAVLDDRSKKDMDLIFTTEGIMPVIKGKVKKIAPYDGVKWNENSSKKELSVDTKNKYGNELINMDELYKLITQLVSYAENDELIGY